MLYIKTMHYVCIAYLRIKIPWKSLATEQTVIELEGVYLIAVPYLSMFVLHCYSLFENRLHFRFICWLLCNCSSDSGD